MTEIDEDELEAPDQLADACNAFVTLTPSGFRKQQFQLAHETCRDYFYQCAPEDVIHDWPDMMARTSLACMLLERPALMENSTWADSLFHTAVSFLLSEMNGVREDKVQDALTQLLDLPGPRLAHLMRAIAEIEAVSEMRFKEWEADVRVELRRAFQRSTHPGDCLFQHDRILAASCIGLTQSVCDTFSTSEIDDGWASAVMFAAFFGRVHFLKQLLELHSDGSVRARFSHVPSSAVHLAVLAPRRGDDVRVETTRLLLEHKMKMDGDKIGGITPLHMASSPILAALLLDHGIPVGVIDYCGWTPLHLAAMYGHVGMAELLLKRHAPIDAMDDKGRTPLYFAVKSRQQTIIELIISKAALDVVDPSTKWTLLHQVLNAARPEPKGFLSRVMNQHNRWAAREIIQLMIQRGASLDVSDYDGNYPLHLAVNVVDAYFIELLINNGVSLDVTDSRGRTPLRNALQTRDDKIVAKLLIERGARLDIVDGEGMTALHYAASDPGVNERVVKMLIDKGAPLDILDRDGLTPLDIAVKFSNKGTTRLLLEHGAPGNAVKSGEQTPLGLIF
jgi:ankyrin repeat protein